MSFIGQVIPELEDTFFNLKTEKVGVNNYLHTLTNKNGLIYTRVLYLDENNEFKYSVFEINTEGGGGQTSNLIISDTMPLDPTNGLKWFNLLTGTTFTYNNNNWTEG